MSNKIRIGSRGSDLALWQANFFQQQLKSIGADSEIIIITTKGDRIQNLSFDKIEGKGFFTKEIEEALLSNNIDVAIHSHKDLETQSPSGLFIGGVSYREDPSELLLVHPNSLDAQQTLPFKEGAIIGTSSARRKSQIRALRPDITIKDIRGNVPTRINKLRNGDFDAILLANAGINRLELDVTDLHAEVLDPRLFIPAPAQGVLAYQCREDDHETRSTLSKLHHTDVANAIGIERGILSGFGGGCHIPIGVYAQPKTDGFTVWASFGKEWEKTPSRVRFSASGKEDALSVFETIKQNRLPSNVFISRFLTDGSYLRNACNELGVAIKEQSLIKTVSTNFDASPSDYDCLVFSSSKGVEAFFSQENTKNWESLKIVAAGHATAAALSQLGLKANLVGEDSDMSRLALKLKDLLENGKALFPGSSRSMGSLQKGLDQAQCTTITCYETHEVHEALDNFEAYIMTSPSNVKSFIEAGNSFSTNAKIIAIGDSTGAALKQYGVHPLVAEIPAEPELFGLLAS